jgi:hypothetical protein
MPEMSEWLGVICCKGILMPENGSLDDSRSKETKQDARNETEPPRTADDICIGEREVREAVGSLLKEAYEHAKKTGVAGTWQEFAVKVLFEDRKDRTVGERVRNLSQVRVEIPDTLSVRLLVNFCRRSEIGVPSLLERFKPRPSDQRPQVSPTKTLKAALGLEKKKADESIENYNGRYLLFTLDPEQRIIVTSYLLSQEKGDDGSPVFQARRRTSEGTLVRSLGAYFSNEHQLYLVGTPVGSIEMRLSIFHIVAVTRQVMVRGVNLRMVDGSIASTRCMLVRDEFKLAIRRELLTGHHSRDRIANFFFEPKRGEPQHAKPDGNNNLVYPKKDSCSANFKEMVGYLYDDNPPQSRPPYILVKGNSDVA